MLWLIFICLIVHLHVYHSKQDFVSFDPYEILQLEIGAAQEDIKKQYRSLSLEFHPDKNRGNVEAEQKFILISKAYQTLTDESTRENYEKYGNPDGFQGMSVTIGLPSFLTRRENELYVLVFYMLSMIMLVIAVAI